MDISLICLIAVGAILVFSLLLGFIRGFRKALVRMVWLLVTAVVVFFATPPLATYFNTFDLSSFNLNIGGPVTRLSDIGVNIIKSLNLEEALNSSPALKSFAENLTTMILNIILFVVLFWILKIIFYPLFLIIYSNVFDKEKRKQKMYQKHIKKLKKNGMPITEDAPPKSPGKMRWLGGLVGVVCGLIVMAVTFSPLLGAHNIYTTVNQSITLSTETEALRLAPSGEEFDEKPYLDTVLPKEVVEMISAYDGSIAKKILTYTGVEFVATKTFGELASVKVGNEKIKLTDEVTTFAKVYKNGIKIYSLTKDYSSLTYSDIDELVNLTRSILDDLIGSKVVYVLGGSMTDYFAEKYLIDYVNGDEFELIIDEKNYADNIQEIINSMDLENFSLNEVKEELNAMLDIVSLFNSIKQTKDGTTVSLLSEMISGNISEPLDAMDFLVEGTANLNSFATSLVNSIYNIGLISNAMPVAVNSGVEALFKALNITGFEEKSDLNNNNIKNALVSVIENSLEVYKVYRTGDDFDFGDKTAVVLGCVGKVMDSLKNNLLSQNSYLPSNNDTNGLINFLISKLNDLTGDIDISSITSSIKEINSFETELSALSPVYDAAFVMATDEEHPFSMDSLLDEYYPNLNSLGSAINTVINAGNSKLINNKNMRAIFSILFNELRKGDLETYNYLETQVNGKTLINTILDNIYYTNPETHESSSKIVNWANEIEYGFDLIRKLPTLSQFGTASKDDIITLGRSMDNSLANSRLLLSPSVIRTLVDKALSEAINPSSELSDILDMRLSSDPNDTSTIKSGLLNNIYNEQTQRSNITSYEEELANIYDLIYANTSTLQNIGAMLDSVADSKMLSRDLVKKVVAKYMQDELDDIADASLKAKLQPAVTSVKNNITNEVADNGKYLVKYAEEFGYIQNLIDTLNNSYLNDGARLSAIGTTFNNILGLASLEENPPHSRLISQATLNSVLSSYITDFINNASGLQTGIRTALLGINSNLDDILNYSIELQYLRDIADDLNSGIFGINFISLGEQIDEILAPTASTLITQDIVNNVVWYFFDTIGDIKDNFSTAFNRMQSKVTSYVGYEQNRYRDLFVEFNTINSKANALADTMSNAYTLADFKANTTIADTLDTLANMTLASDRYIARDIAGVIIDKILDLCNNQSTTLKDSVEAKLNEAQYDFGNYHENETDGWIATADDSTYYALLIADIQSLLP